MKKHLLTVSFLIIVLGSYAQSFKEDPSYIKQAPNAKGYMLDTVSSSKLTKQQLYSNALNYISNSSKDIRNVVEMKDVELGEISYKGNTFTNVSVSDTTKKGKITSHYETIRLMFRCKIYLKDNKFKIVLNSLEKPFMALMSGGITVPVDPYYKGVGAHEYKVASELALSMIKQIAAALNQSPENDF